MRNSLTYGKTDRYHPYDPSYRAGSISNDTKALGTRYQLLYFHEHANCLQPRFSIVIRKRLLVQPQQPQGTPQEKAFQPANIRPFQLQKVRSYSTAMNLKVLAALASVASIFDDPTSQDFNALSLCDTVPPPQCGVSPDRLQCQI